MNCTQDSDKEELSLHGYKNIRICQKLFHILVDIFGAKFISVVLRIVVTCHSLGGGGGGGGGGGDIHIV